MPERIAYSPGEAAQVVGVSRQTIYNWLNDGRLASTKIGRSRRIPATALSALVEGDLDAA